GEPEGRRRAPAPLRARRRTGTGWACRALLGIGCRGFLLAGPAGIRTTDTHLVTSVPAMGQEEAGVLSARELSKAYHSGDAVEQVLNGVSLEVARGRFVSIMGPS